MAVGYLIFCQSPHDATGDCPVEQRVEIALDTDSFQSPWNLSVEDATQLTGAILLVWAVAWCYRMIIRIFNQSDEGVSNE